MKWLEQLTDLNLIKNLCMEVVSQIQPTSNQAIWLAVQKFGIRHIVTASFIVLTTFDSPHLITSNAL